MRNLVIYIDGDKKEIQKMKRQNVISWNGDFLGENISNYLDRYKIRIRKKYLTFIENLEKKKISGLTIKKILQADNFHNLWEYSLIKEKCPIKSPRIADSLKLFCLEEIIIKRNIKEIYLFSNDKRMINSLIYLCKKSGIKLISSKNYDSIYENKYESYFILLKAVFYIIRLFVRQLSFLKIGKKEFYNSHKISIFSYLLNFEIVSKRNSLVFLSKYWFNLPSLIKKKSKKINWFHQSVGLNYESNLIKKLSRVNDKTESHYLIFNFISFKIFILSALEFIKFIIKKKSRKDMVKIFRVDKSNINLWFLMSEDWHKSLFGSDFFYSILMKNTFDDILSKLPKQKLGIYLYENQSWEKVLLTSWKKYNHNTIVGVAHSTVRFWDLRYYSLTKINYPSKKSTLLLPDKIAVNGFLADKTIKQGINKTIENKLIQVEALRFFHLKKNKKVLNRRVSSNKTKNVLLIGDIDIENTKSLLNSINPNEKRLRKYNLSFRGHPGALLVSFAKSSGFKISNENNIYDALKNNDIIIVSGSSSVALESIVLNKPTVVFLNNKQLNLSPASEIKGIQFAQNSNDLIELIISCKYKKPNSMNNLFWLDKKLNKWNRNLEKLINAN